MRIEAAVVPETSAVAAAKIAVVVGVRGEARRSVRESHQP
jgi:hypothetical protein